MVACQPTTEPIEQRRFTRYVVPEEVPASIGSPKYKSKILGRLVDISIAGALVELDRIAPALSTGARVTFDVELPRTAPIQVRAAIARSFVDNGRQRVALSFVDNEGACEARTRLTVYLVAREGLADMQARIASILEITSSIRSRFDDLGALLAANAELERDVLDLARAQVEGTRHRIDTIGDAVRCCGFRAIANNALTLSAIRLFPVGERREEAICLWMHSIATAYVAEHLDSKDRGDGLVFVSALLHDLGRFLLLRTLPLEWRAVLLRVAGGAPTRDAEAAVFGVTHDRVNATLCELVRFPRAIEVAMLHHHDNVVRPPRELAIVQAADAAARDLGFAFPVESERAAPPLAAIAALGMTLATFYARTVELAPVMNAVRAWEPLLRARV